MKNIFKKSAAIGVLLLVFVGIISCEKDFTNIGSSVVSNSKFSTKDTIIDITVTNAPIESVRADGLNLSRQPFFGFQGQYLLGTYINDEYEDVEASIISQINIDTDLELVTYSNPDELEVITTIDSAFLRLPYQATLLSNTDKPDYRLDSIVGDQTLPFTLNIYELDTYLSTLNPSDPSKTNVFLSDYSYQTKPNSLTAIEDMDFFPSTKDTLLIIKRKDSNGDLYDTDTISYTANNNSNVPLPMAIIPLKKSFIQQIFFDNYGGANFASQEAFNDYFRGIIIEAKEKTHLSGLRGGALISFKLQNSNLEALKPLIEVYYTNTFIKNNSTEIDTIFKRNHSYQLGGIINNKFNMNNRVYPDNNEVKVQGLAGSEAEVEILNATQLSDLRNKNWLINDASLTFYINQSSDTTYTPYRMFLYKNGENNNSTTILSQIKDTYTEGQFSFGGNLVYENNKKDHYTFRITDYISDLIGNESTYNPPLRLKVHNTSDFPISISDTLYTRYSWSPKAVSILNGDELANGERRAQLKISYTEKKN